MKCAYCLEEMNDGARVCRACGRRQPISTLAKVVVLLLVAVLAALGLGGYFVVTIIGRTQRINALVLCVTFRGGDRTKDLDALEEKIKLEIENMAAGDLSWENSYKIEALALGCPAH